MGTKFVDEIQSVRENPQQGGHSDYFYEPYTIETADFPFKYCALKENRSWNWHEYNQMVVGGVGFRTFANRYDRSLAILTSKSMVQMSE